MAPERPSRRALRARLEGRGMLMQPSLEAAELIDERPDERLDTSRLEPYLRARLERTEKGRAEINADSAGMKY